MSGDAKQQAEKKRAKSVRGVETENKAGMQNIHNVN